MTNARPQSIGLTRIREVVRLTEHGNLVFDVILIISSRITCARAPLVYAHSVKDSDYACEPSQGWNHIPELDSNSIHCFSVYQQWLNILRVLVRALEGSCVPNSCALYAYCTTINQERCVETGSVLLLQYMKTLNINDFFFITHRYNRDLNKIKKKE